MDQERRPARERRMRRETRAIWATVACFVLGAAVGVLVLRGNPRPVAGDGSVGIPAALIAGVIAAASFLISTRLHRRGDHAGMPRWQAVISALSAAALTVAFAAVTALGVLLAGEILGVGLQGLELPALGGGLLVGVASALAGRLAFEAGVGLRTADLAALLFGFLVIGTLFAMLTATDARWWERNFSQLGIGTGAWAFNGTLVVAGLLVATVGSYIGRDLHRIGGDAALGLIAWVVVLWASTGVVLAGVGLLPLERIAVLHNIFAIAALVLFITAGIMTTVVMPGPPPALLLTAAGTALLIVVAVVLGFGFGVYPVTALEAIVIGLCLVWMTTLVRILAVLTPSATRPARRALLPGRRAV